MPFRLLLGLHWFTWLIAAQNLPGVTTPASTPRIYIIHVTLIDTVVGKELPDRIVVISGDRISEVKAAKSAKPPSDAQIIEGKGKYLIPGLWDMHVHALFPERLDSMFPMFVANGVLGIRDMGTSMPLTEILKGGGADLVKVYSWLSKDTFLAIADEAKKQKIPFAGHVPFSVSALEASDAGMNSMEHMFGVYLSCSSREDELRGEMLKGGPNLDGWDRIRLEVFDATDSYDEAKAAKVFANLAKNRTWQVPTFTAVWANARGFDALVTSDPRLKYIPPSVQQRWSQEAKSSTTTSAFAKFHAQQLRILGDLHRAGVPVMAGTDEAWYQAYTYAGFSLHDELSLLVRAGFTPMEALQSATIDPARFLSMEKDLGSVEKGKLADLVLLSADPLQDMTNTQKIEAVIVRGRMLDRSALNSLLAGAENAVKNQ
jgi:imidazolonepropionase-like amidohydrolase